MARLAMNVIPDARNVRHPMMTRSRTGQIRRQRSQRLRLNPPKRPQRLILLPPKRPQRLRLGMPRKPIRLVLRGPRPIKKEEDSVNVSVHLCL